MSSTGHDSLQLKQEKDKQTQLKVDSYNNVQDESKDCMEETRDNLLQGTTSDVDDKVLLSLQLTQSGKDEASSAISYLALNKSTEPQNVIRNLGCEEKGTYERREPCSQVELPSRNVSPSGHQDEVQSNRIQTVKPVSVRVLVCPDHFGEDLSIIDMRRFEDNNNEEMFMECVAMAQIFHGPSEIEALVYVYINGKFHRADKLPATQRVSLSQTWRINSPRSLMYSFDWRSPLEAKTDRPVKVGSHTSVGGRPPEHVTEMSADFDGSPPADTGQFVFGYRPEVDGEGLTVSRQPSDADNDEGVADTGPVTMTQEKVLIQVIFKLQFPNGDWPENRLSYKVWVSYPFCNLITDLCKISTLIAGEAVRSTLEYKQWDVDDYQQLPDLSAVHSNQHLDIPRIVGNQSLQFIVNTMCR